MVWKRASVRYAIRLFDYPSSGNCYKVRLLLSHLAVEYEKVAIDIFAGDTLTQQFAWKNPGLRTPVIEISPGRFLPESGAILTYLSEGTALMPTDAFVRAQAMRWLFFEQSSILPTIAGTRFMLLTGRLDPDSEQARARSATAQAVVAVVNRHVSEFAFAAGDDFSVADIALFGYLHVANEAGVAMESFPDLASWLGRVRDQPRHIEDLLPYPDNARPGAGRSLYDFVSV